MISALVLVAALSAAPPTADQLALLTTFRDEFVQITPGEGKFPKSFLMGSADESRPNAQPVHRVEFGYTFEMARYEVPQNLWQAVMGSNPSRWKGPRNSVEEISFADAQQFCDRATRLMRAAGLIRQDQLIRLPTEAEWEYVCRAGTQTVYSFGDDPSLLDRYAWHTGNAAGNDPPVGAKQPNPWGLYDMHGYLREWCLDVAHGSYQGAPTNGSAWLEGGTPGRRIVRGGSWKDRAEHLTCAYRLGVDRGFRPADVGAVETLRDDALGLRCVLVSADDEAASSD